MVEIVTESGRPIISKLTWRLVPFLFLLYIVAYLDRINVGFAALQMQKQLGFTDAVYGFAAGIFFAGYVPFQIPSNLALKRIGARRWIAALMVAWGLISASMLFVRTPRTFYILRFLLGMAEAGFFPGVILYLKGWVPPAARAKTVALFMTAGPIAGVIGGPISGALMNLRNLGDLAGWQWLFLIEGLPAILLGLAVLRFLSDEPQYAKWLSERERTWLMNTLRDERTSTSTKSRSHFFEKLVNANILPLAIVYFGLNICSYGISLWLPSVIRSMSGIGNFSIGLLSAIPYLLAAVAMTLASVHSDWTGERRWHVIIPAFAGGAALFAGAFSGSVAVLLVAISIAVIGLNSMLGPFWAMASALLAESAAAAGIALINSIGNFGGFVGPYMIGQLRGSASTFRSGLLFAGAGLALSGCAALLIRFRGAKIASE